MASSPSLLSASVGSPPVRWQLLKDLHDEMTPAPDGPAFELQEAGEIAMYNGEDAPCGHRLACTCSWRCVPSEGDSVRLERLERALDKQPSDLPPDCA